MKICSIATFAASLTMMAAALAQDPNTQRQQPQPGTTPNPGRTTQGGQAGQGGMSGQGGMGGQASQQIQALQPLVGTFQVSGQVYDMDMALNRSGRQGRSGAGAGAGSGTMGDRSGTSSGIDRGGTSGAGAGSGAGRDPNRRDPNTGDPGTREPNRPGMDPNDRVPSPGDPNIREPNRRGPNAQVGSGTDPNQRGSGGQSGQGGMGQGQGGAQGQGGMGGQGQSCTGTVTAEWILDNNFVHSMMRGSYGGEQIEGMGLCGYDEAKNRFVSTWVDSHCQTIQMATGTYDPASKTFTYTGDYTTPDGQTIRTRKTVRVVSNDEHVMTAYATTAGQGEKKILELNFRRTGAAGGAGSGTRRGGTN